MCSPVVGIAKRVGICLKIRREGTNVNSAASGGKIGLGRWPMARGWESKSVESQIEDAGSRPSRSSQIELLTAEQRAIRQKLQGLELSRRRVLQDLEMARSPVRRAALEQALAFLDQEIRKLAPQ